MKFTTPVSMRVTQQQFEQDLKQPLIDLGYDVCRISDWAKFPYLVTWFNKVHNQVSNIGEPVIPMYYENFIYAYNPKLFLALAAMTDEPKGIVGEWFNERRSGNFFKKIYPSSDYSYHYKATKEELIAHFTEEVEGVIISDEDISGLIDTKNQNEIDYAISVLRSAGFKGTLTREETITF